MYSRTKIHAIYSARNFQKDVNTYSRYQCVIYLEHTRIDEAETENIERVHGRKHYYYYYLGTYTLKRRVTQNGRPRDTDDKLTICKMALLLSVVSLLLRLCYLAKVET